jgi:hypothetical protein
MAEDPIKLFATRSERFPQPDDVQTLREAIEKGIEQVPVAGPITNFIVSRFWAPSASRRLEEWLKEFADDFDRHCAGCSVENIVQDEAFISASIQVARIVVSTHQREKLDYLRNALLNIAIGKGVGEVKQQIFLNAIESFTPAHVKTLNLIWRSLNPGWDQHSVPLPLRTYSRAIELLVPEIKGQPAIIAAVLADLRNRGLTTLSSADIQFPQGGLVTNLTAEFLNFVLNPQDLPK